MRNSKEEHLKTSDYIAIVSSINDWVKDKQWKKMLIKDSVTNEKVAKNILEIIDKASVNLEFTEIEQMMLKVREKSEGQLEKINKLNQPEKWLYTRELYCYYAIHEALVECSQFSDDIVSEMVNALGDNYTEKIKEIDKLNPSKLTNFKFENRNFPNYINLPEVKKYLLLKEWQDLQHIYHTNKLYPIFESVWDEFDEWVNKNFPEYNEFEDLKLAFINMRNKTFLDVESLAKFVLTGFDNEVTKMVGGKAIGLLKLHINGLKIPETFFIPKMKLNDFNELDENFNFERFAVRSSATTEDAKENSFAGLFDSYLDVGRKDLHEKIDAVAKSVDNDRVKAYISRLDNVKPEMSVIIQEFKNPDYSGVWIGNDLNHGILEWTKGTGDKLVSGTITPKTEIWNNNAKVDSPLSIKNKTVAEYCIRVQKKLNSVADLEWCIIDNELIWLQYRPVTKLINAETPTYANNKDSDLIYGIPASSGITSGNLIFLNDYDEVDNWKEGSILLTYATDPNWVPVILNAKAMITADGGFLSHTAIISRELNIPCITGIGDDALEKLKKAHTIEVNGSIGSIKIINDTIKSG